MVGCDHGYHTCMVSEGRRREGEGEEEWEGA